MDDQTQPRRGRESIQKMLTRFNDKEILTIGRFGPLYQFFPTTDKATIAQLQMDKEAVYSTTNPALMSKIINIMYEQLDVDSAPAQRLTITDATANVGGSAICFALAGHHVIAHEIVPATWEMLCNNVKVFGLDGSGRSLAGSVSMICGDYSELMMQHKQDVVFVDPPWGGAGYSRAANIRLKLGEATLAEIANRLRSRARLVLFKVPINFDYCDFTAGLRGVDHTCYNLKSFWIIATRPCRPRCH